MRNFLRAMILLMLACGLMCATAYAGDGVIVQTELIVRDQADLKVQYQYPSFYADDAEVAAALNSAISDTCLAWYVLLHDEFEAHAASRTPTQADLYAQGHADGIIGEFEAQVTEDGLLQIRTAISYWPAGATDNRWLYHCYVFDVQRQCLLTPADFFGEDEQAVYAALSGAAAAQAMENDAFYEHAAASASVDDTTPFYYTAHNQTLHLIYDPYTLAPTMEELHVPVHSLALTPVDLGLR